jgi:hypothetical protein
LAYNLPDCHPDPAGAGEASVFPLYLVLKSSHRDTCEQDTGSQEFDSLLLIGLWPFAISHSFSDGDIIPGDRHPTRGIPNGNFKWRAEAVPCPFHNPESKI